MPTTDGAEANALPPELNHRALEALNAPELHETPLPSGFVTLARLWHYEGRGAWRAWSLSSRSSAVDTTTLRIRKVVWDRTAEFARFTEAPTPGADALTPRLALSEARFPVESWETLIQEASTLKVQPVFPEAASAPSGVRDRFGFSYQLPTQAVSFAWWDPPPAEWKGLAEWAARVRVALDAWLGR